MSYGNNRIAIIGLACLFPGASNPDAFWNNLINGVNSTTPATDAEFSADPAIFYDPTKSRIDTTYFAHGGFVRDTSGVDTLDGFDNPFTWSLYVARESLKDSGYLEKADILKQTGLILGNLSFPTRLSHLLSAPIYDDAVEDALRELLGNPDFELGRLPEPTQIDLRNALISGQPASIVASMLGLGKTHFAIDAACASSLYAIGLACEYLQSGRADMMLAGAVNGADPLFVNMGFTHFGAYPNTPEYNRPLDSTTEGLISGEGAGMFVLKRLEDAERDGDQVHAVIAGIGLANDGRGKHPLTPNPRGQILALRRAYTQVAPTDVQYVECHASGTPLGDKTELNSMDEFFGEHHTAPLIGSVKSNVGHLLTTAGAASVLKVILSLKHGIIPGTLNVHEPMLSQNGVFGASQIITQNTPYPDAQIRRAGVNAFGFGGVSAHMVLEPPPAQASPSASPQATITEHKPQQRMAIVGMAAEFADINTLETLRQTIYDGKQHFRDLPEQRWKGLIEDAPRGAYMDSFEIDFMRYKLPPKDDEQPIPQQLLLLKVADAALRDAEFPDSGNVAVIVAIGTELNLHQVRGRLDLSWQIREGLAQSGIELTAAQVDYLESISKDALNPQAQVNQYTSFIGNIISSRVAALWNFSGPAFTISSDENSVYKALEMAQLLLADTDIDGVVVGAVDLAGGVENIVIRHHMASVNDGKETLTFDAETDGWIPGEGAGAIVLTRADNTTNKRVYAYIDAVSLVESNAINSDSVQHAAHEALHVAGLKPDDIGYIEANASGIAEEDATEINALHAVYGNDNTPESIALGSIKANIGHTFAASGVASIIKTALTLYDRFIPAVPDWKAPSNLDAWQNSPFYVATESKTWFAPTGQPRHAAISGLGMDNAAAHLILSEGDHNTAPTMTKHQPLKLILVDADTRAGLMGRLGQLETALKDGTSLDVLASRAFQVYIRRAFTLALIAKDGASLQKEIDAARKGLPTAFDNNSEWQTPAGSYFTPNPVGTNGKVAFVYPGAFNSYPGVAQNLLTLFPSAHDHLLMLTKNAGNAIADELIYQRSLTAPTRAEIRAFRSRIAEDQVAMMQSGTTFAILFTHVAQNVFKIKPDAAFGYSIGEGSMMWAMGVWRDGDTAQDRFGHSPLFRNRLYGRKEAVREYWHLPDNASNDFWASYVVTAPVEIVEAVAQNETRVYVTHINTPKEVVIAGEPAACERVIAQLTEQIPGLLSVKAPFEAVIHSEAMASEYDEFFRVHNNTLATPLPDVTFYSAADYAPVVLNQEAVAHNITRVTVKQVDFPRLIRRTYADGARIFIELGPGSTCTRWIDDTLAGEPHIAVAIDNLRTDEHTAIVKMLARLVSHRVSMDLSPLYKATTTKVSENRQLLRRITLGGTPIKDILLSDDVRHKFEELEKQTQPAVVQPSAQPPVQLAKAPEKRIAVVEEPHNKTVEHVNELKADISAQTPETSEAPASPAEKTPMMETMTESQKSQRMQTRLQELRQLGESIRAQLANTTTASVPASAPAQPEAVTPSRPNIPTPPERFTPSEPIFTTWQIDQFARGSIKACFGDEYAIYDDVRAPRIPNTELMFVSRVVKIDATRLQTKVGSSLVMEYDVPNDIWYYENNPYPFTPYSVLMEMALQPCGFLSAFMGPTFDFADIDFYFRNLDGNGELTRNVDLRGRTLTNRVELLSSTILQGIIIQKYSFNMMLDGDSFYTGESTFGYFTMQALSSQAGLDMGKKRIRWHVENPDVPMKTVTGSRQQEPAHQSLLEMPDGMLAFIDDAQISLNGGKDGKGYIYGHTIVDPSDWFFRCHFHQDPVMPGSLGLESVSQAIQMFAIEAGLGVEFKQPHFENVENNTMIWKYRGQVLGDSRHVYVEVHITEIERLHGKINIYADASLWKGDLRIYEFKRVGVCVQESE